MAPVGYFTLRGDIPRYANLFQEGNNMRSFILANSWNNAENPPEPVLLNAQANTQPQQLNRIQETQNLQQHDRNINNSQNRPNHFHLSRPLSPSLGREEPNELIVHEEQDRSFESIPALNTSQNPNAENDQERFNRLEQNLQINEQELIDCTENATEEGIIRQVRFLETFRHNRLRIGHELRSMNSDVNERMTRCLNREENVGKLSQKTNSESEECGESKG